MAIVSFLIRMRSHVYVFKVKMVRLSAQIKVILGFNFSRFLHFRGFSIEEVVILFSSFPSALKFFALVNLLRVPTTSEFDQVAFVYLA